MFTGLFWVLLMWYRQLEDPGQLSAASLLAPFASLVFNFCRMRRSRACLRSISVSCFMNFLRLVRLYRDFGFRCSSSDCAMPGLSGHVVQDSNSQLTGSVE
jgi:hypothetical protein